MAAEQRRRSCSSRTSFIQLYDATQYAARVDCGEVFVTRQISAARWKRQGGPAEQAIGCRRGECGDTAIRRCEKEFRPRAASNKTNGRQAPDARRVPPAE